LFETESGFPFYYRKLAYGMSDVKTVKHLVADLGNLGFSKVKIKALYQNDLKFLMAQNFPINMCKKSWIISGIASVPITTQDISSTGILP
jgi:hypothetical protein